MARWEPDARGRLQKAAMELFEERGYAATTVQEIAAHAGLTERTFFRYFADKREALFAGSEILAEVVARALADAPPVTGPLERIEGALAATSEIFDPRREGARHRRSVIHSHPELLERELMKLTSLARSIAESLRATGTSELAAHVAAETGITLFRITFDRFLDDPDKRSFAEHVHAAFAELRVLTAPSPRPPRGASRRGR